MLPPSLQSNAFSCRRSETAVTPFRPRKEARPDAISPRGRHRCTLRPCKEAGPGTVTHGAHHVALSLMDNKRVRPPSAPEDTSETWPEGSGAINPAVANGYADCNRADASKTLDKPNEEDARKGAEVLYCTGLY